MINDLIDLAYVGSAKDEQYNYEYFRLVYCNPKIQFFDQPFNISVIISAFPTGNFKDEAIKYLSSMTYKDFLQTAYWRSISSFVKHNHGNRCATCGSSKFLTVHHKTYEHRGEEFFYLNDLTCLCYHCHNKFHGK